MNQEEIMRQESEAARTAETPVQKTEAVQTAEITVQPEEEPQKTETPVQAEEEPQKTETPVQAGEETQKAVKAGYFRVFGAACGLYAVMFSFCLYRNHNGITYPFFMGATILLFYLFLYKAKRKGQKGNCFFTVSLMLLAISKCTTGNGVIQDLDTVAVLLLLGILILRNFVEGFAVEANIFHFIREFCALWFFPLTYLEKPFQEAYAFLTQHRKKEKSGNGVEILIGLLIAIPLLVIVLALLSSADVVFGKLIENLLDGITLPKNMWDVILITLQILTVYLASYCLSVHLLRGEKRVLKETGKYASAVRAVIVTGALSIVYLLFCLIQVRFLFIGGITLPDGYTYSGYVHEGFNQLLAVCLLNLVILSFIRVRFEIKGVLRGLLTLFVLCTYVMTASAGMRIYLYIREYHLTFQRILVIWALVVAALCMTLMLVQIYHVKWNAFRYCLYLITIMYLALVLSHPDYWIARYNINAMKDEIPQTLVANAKAQNPAVYDRFMEENGYADFSTSDIYYLFQLSSDAAPALKENPAIWGYYKYYHGELDVQQKKITLESIRTCNISALIADKLR